ncbi:hypothetical protein BKA70DRAFT_1432929 [Coprinopsis sp. MPI-PUGE-AT-0042]|nr:hypothetical protein BKA70DRAFT_1432929 [Coprinopsis sp. MPI-PUGE-AT-0042]
MAPKGSKDTAAGKAAAKARGTGSVGSQVINEEPLGFEEKDGTKTAKETYAPDEETPRGPVMMGTFPPHPVSGDGSPRGLPQGRQHATGSEGYQNIDQDAGYEGKTESAGGQVSTSNGLESDNAAEEVDIYNLPDPLVPLSTPMNNVGSGGVTSRSSIYFLGCYSSADYRDNTFALDRIQDGLRIGRRNPSGNLVRLAYTRHLSRNERREELREVLDMLSDLVLNVKKFTTNSPKKEYFAISAKKLVELNTALLALRTRSEEALKMTGMGSPDIPIWGINGSTNAYWNANDFEILAICYRYEVECFLAIIRDAQFQYDAMKKTVKSALNPFNEQISVFRAPTNVKPVEFSNQGWTPDVREMQTSPKGAQYREPAAQLFTNSASAYFNAPPQTRFMSMNRAYGPATVPQVVSSRKMTELFAEPRFAEPRASERDAQQDPNRNPYRNAGQNQRAPHQADFGDQRHSTQPPRVSGARGNPGDPSDSSSDDSNDDRRRPRSSPRRNPRNPSRRRDDRDEDRSSTSMRARETSTPQMQFDYKLKVDTIPTWDGNLDTLVRWMSKVNRLSNKSPLLHQQLGALVPSRLTGNAEVWYYSLPLLTRDRYEEDWTNMKNGIAAYYMNRSFTEKQKIKANKAHYRDYSHSRETPSEYFIRKVELLQFSYNYSDSETISEIMAGAPTLWTSILTPHLYDDLVAFQQALKFHEETLLRLDSTPTHGNPFIRNRDDAPRSRNPYHQAPNFKAQTKLVGASDKIKPPMYPKDDQNMSKRGIPADKGFRPCRHCGSGNHWDDECKYSRRAMRKARANLVNVESEDEEAQREYDDFYYGLQSEDETDGPDFH